MALAQERTSLLPLLREGMPDARGWLNRKIAVAVIVLVALVIPAMLSSSGASYVAFGVIYAIVGLSLNVLMGYAGQVSLGHHAFVGVGAFASAYAVSHVSNSTTGTVPFPSFLFGVVVAMALGALAAIALGFVALRLKGLYLALITLAYGLIAQNVIFDLDFLGGAAGAHADRPVGFANPAACGQFSGRFDCQKSYVYLCYLFLGLVLFVDWRLVKSKAGRAIFAIRENEIAAASFGINVVSYKLLAFVFSGAVAGLAGALYADWASQVNAGAFDFQLALTFVLMVAVGGLQSRAGIVLSSMFFAIFPLVFATKVTLPIVHWTIPPLDVWVPIIGSLLLLFTLAMFPGGLGQQLRPITEWLRGKPFSMKHDEGGVQTGGAGVRP